MFSSDLQTLIFIEVQFLLPYLIDRITVKRFTYRTLEIVILDKSMKNWCPEILRKPVWQFSDLIAYSTSSQQVSCLLFNTFQSSHKINGEISQQPFYLVNVYHSSHIGPFMNTHRFGVKCRKQQREMGSFSSQMQPNCCPLWTLTDLG